MLGEASQNLLEKYEENKHQIAKSDAEIKVGQLGTYLLD